jgi:hypothetical protein
MTATSSAATTEAASAYSTAAAHTVAARHYCLNSQILSKNYKLLAKMAGSAGQLS